MRNLTDLEQSLRKRENPKRMLCTSPHFMTANGKGKASVRFFLSRIPAFVLLYGLP